MSIRDLIDGLNLQEGKNIRVDCPNCGGSRTLSIASKLGEVKYNCFRLGCDTYGRYADRIDVDHVVDALVDNTKRPSKHKLKGTIELYDNFFDPSPNALKWFNQYPVSSRFKEELHYDPKENRAVFLYGDSETGYAAIGRTLDKGVKPKWKKYGNCLLPFQRGCGKTVVLVEDVVSALAVSALEDYTAIALGGTYMVPGLLGHIAKFSNAIVALDKDATYKGQKEIEAKLQWVLPTRSVLLEHDLKIYPKEDLWTILK